MPGATALTVIAGNDLAAVSVDVAGDTHFDARRHRLGEQVAEWFGRWARPRR